MNAVCDQSKGRSLAAGCRFSVVDVGLDHRSYSTLGLVGASVGDRLWTGKPPRRQTRHAGKGGGALCAGNAVALLVFGPVMP